MFRRLCHARVIVMVLCVTVAAISSAACHGKAKEKPPAEAPAAAVVPPQSLGFELTPPPGYRQVAAPAPLTAAWEAPASKNGFTPTLNLARRPVPLGTPDQIYATWRDELMGVLKKQYTEVRVLSERAIGEAGKLIIVVVTLPIPGGKTPMPLFTYGAIFTQGKSLWVLGAITNADLDVQTGNITPANEPEILKALASFHLR